MSRDFRDPRTGSRVKLSARPRLERLEPRLLLDGGRLVISEFMALNQTTLQDEDEEYSDWIEIHNPTDAVVDLGGWYLTDNALDLRGWEFPPVSLDPNGYLVVFASNKDRDAGELHTNFRLERDGEYLALVEPDGVTICHEFAPQFPPQTADASYGLTHDVKRYTREGSLVSYLVPSVDQAGVETSWYAPDFDDSAWVGSGTAPAVRLTEVGTGDPDFVEIQNLSGQPVSTSGWVVAVNDATDIGQPSDVNAVHSTLWNLPPSMAVNEVLSRDDINDGEGDYWGENIFWRTFGPGWAMILDGAGNVADFAVWNYTPAEIASLDVTIGGHHVTGEGLWIGDAILPNVGPEFSLQRVGGVDHDDASDWESVSPITRDEQNADLSLPFPAGPTVGVGFSLLEPGFGELVRTNVAGDMLGVNSSLWARVPFDVDNPLLLDTLLLRMKYDDGFAAYLNGQEIARRNAPDPLHWDSAALADRPDAQATTYQDIDVTQHLGLLRQGRNLLAIQGLNEESSNGEFLVLPELAATTTEGVLRFMEVATPGELNDLGITEAPVFSQQNGIFVDPFSVSLQVASSTATLHYTTDGSIPDEDSPVYAGPISVSTSTRIRARANEPERGLGPVVSQGYVFLDSSAVGFDSDVPIIVVETYGKSLGDTMLTPATAVFIQPGADGRTHLVDQHEFAGRAGIRRRGQSSQGWPKGQYAFEVWDEGNDDSRPIRSTATPDLAVSLFGLPAESDWVIQGPYSDKSLMRNYLSYSWSNEIGLYAPRVRFCEVFLNTQGGKIEYPGRILTAPPGSGNYEDGYVGTYVFMEKIKIDNDRVDIARLTPDDNQSPDVTGGYIYKKDKSGAGDRPWSTSVAGQQLRHVDPDAAEITGQQDAYLKSYINQMETAIFGANFTDPDTGYAAYLDPPSFIENWILVEMTKNIDGFRLSTYYHKDRGGKVKMGPIWDYNLSLGNADYLAGWLSSGWYNSGISHDPKPIRSANSQYPYWDRLFEDPDFSQLLVDRWQELRRDTFTTDELLADVDRAADAIRESQARNFNKWRILGRRLWPNWYIAQTWQQEIDWMKNWLTARVNWMDRQFLAGVDFSQPGGIVEPGFEVTLDAPAGTIYYTVDGSDPRLPGGSVNSASARIYTGEPIVVTQTTLVKARVLAANQWSPWSGLNSAEFYIGQAAGKQSLAITELNYNPYDPVAAELAVNPELDNDDFEFVEFRNVSQVNLVLSGVQFTQGITFDFTTADVRTLQPGQYAAIARDADAFRLRYGTGIELAGQYSRGLSNDGEPITVLGRDGEVIFDFTYRDRGDWPGRANGKGAALELIDPAAVPQEEPDRTNYLQSGDNWRSSIRYGGTPGADPEAAVGVVVNEVLARTLDAGDTIELYNATAADVDIGGWYLSDSWGWASDPGIGDYKKFQIPPDTIIPADGYRVFDEADFNPSGGFDPELHPRDFALNGAHGDDVWLMKADAADNLTHFADHVDFGPVEYGETLGRWPDGTGDLYPMLTPTLDKLNPQDGENSGPRVGPVVIGEVHYNPWPVGDDSDVEYVELFNPTHRPADLTRWEIRGVIDFDFPDDTTIGPRDTLVVLPFLIDEIDKWTAFCAEYGLDPAVTAGFIGDYSGRLNDDAGRVTLRRAGAESLLEPGYFPLLTEDEVRYDDGPPWPTEPDGGGLSLGRVAIDAWGNSHTGWQAAQPTPGSSTLVPVEPWVVDRRVFYNSSAFDGDDPAAAPGDDAAIAPDKQALLPGQTATFANYTSFSRGVNGLMVDVGNLPQDGTLDAGDFQFSVGNSNDPGTWGPVAVQPDVTVRRGDGSGGSDRITLIWPDNVIQKQWLEVTVLANNDTGLGLPDVFYFGNAIGESGNSTSDAKVTVNDMLGARDNYRTLLDPAPIDFAFDYDRDARVKAADMLIARDNQTHFLNALKLITVPGPKSAAPQPSQVSADAWTWLHEFQQTTPKKRRDAPADQLAPGESPR